jgi:polysaccharide biosynthesis transport protein
VAMDRLTPMEYESVSEVLINRGQPESAYNSRVRVLSWEEDLNSELEVVASPHILALAQKLLDSGKVRDSHGKPIKIKPTRITSTTPGKSSVIVVKVRDPDPQAAREIARSVTQAYKDFRLTVRTVPEIDTFFQERIEEVRAQIEDWEERRVGFMAEESIAKIQDQRYSVIQVKEQAEKDLTGVNENLAADESRVELLRAMVERAKEDPSQEIYAFSETGQADDQVILQIRRELVTRRSELYAARARYQENHPDVLQLVDQVAQLQQLLVQEVGNYLRHFEARVEVLRSRADALRTSIEYCDGELASFPTKEARLDAFDRMIDRLQTEYKSLIDRQIEVQMERAGTPDWNVLVLQPASDPVPVRVNDTIRLAVIPVIGFFVALALAFVLDGMDHSLKDATEVERHLGLPVLGSIGRML